MARRLAAIMAGDVVGYSRLMADDEAGTYDSLRAGVDEVVVPSVTTRGGRVFKTTGDGFLAVFDSAGEALDAAVAIQDGFAGRPLQLRIGLNLGDVIQDQGDVFGDGVNVAARLEAMAEPGGVCASVAVVRAIGRRSDLHFTPLGRRRGKNLPDPIEVHVLRRGPAGQTWLPRGWAMAAAASLALAVGGGGRLAVGLAAHARPGAAADGRAGHRRGQRRHAPDGGGAAVRQSQRRPGPGLFQRRAERGHHHRARSQPRAPGDRAQLHLRLQGPADRHPRGRRQARRPLRGRGQHAPGRRPAAGRGPADRRRDRGASVVAELRPSGRGRVRGADRRDAPDRGGAGFLRARFGIVVGRRSADRVAAGLRSGPTGPRALPARQGGPGGDGGGARPVSPARWRSTRAMPRPTPSWA